MTTPSEPVEPEPRRQGGLITSPRLTAGLAILVVVLVAIILIPSLNLPRVVLIFGDQATPTATAATTEPAGSPTPTASPTFTRPTPTPVPTFLTYVVKPGDSLGSIATAYRTTARSIAWWNRGTYPSLDPESATYSPNLIAVGWTLVLIPGVIVDDAHPPSPSPGRATPAPGASPAATAGPGLSPSPGPSR